MRSAARSIAHNRLPVEFDAAGIARWIEPLARGREELADFFVERRRDASLSFEDGELIASHCRSASGVAARWAKPSEQRLCFVSGAGDSAVREALRALQGSLRRPALPIKPAPPGEPEVPPPASVERWRKRLAAMIPRHAPRHRLRWTWTEVAREVVPARGTPCGHTRRLVSLEGTFLAASRRRDETRSFSFHSPESESTPDELRTALAAAAAPREAPVPCGDGETDVVLANGCAAVLFHEILSHALEGQPSPLTGLAEARLAVSDLDVRDDATRLDLFGGYEWDDEATRPRSVKLLDGGRLAGRLTGRLGDEASNGHGRRAHATEFPLVRGSNIVVAPGQASREEIARRLRAGVWIEDFDGGSVELSAGTFRLRFPRARRVRHGRLAEELGPGILAGEIVPALKGVETGLGRDARTYRALGWCARSGQVVPVQGCAPDVLIRRLSVRGAR